MTEHRLDTPPEWSSKAWHDDRPTVDHAQEEAHRPRMALAAAAAAALAHELEVDGIADLGAGAGGLLRMLAGACDDAIELVGYDFHDAAVAAADELVLAGDITLLAARRQIVRPPWRTALVTATEVLEHLDDPHTLVANLAADPRVVAVVASSPRDETPTSYSEGHRWAWNEAGYRYLFIAAGFHVNSLATVGPFQIITATKESTP